MARPQKQTVDYFPHMVRDSKTKDVLVRKYGNDGYAFWFELLELLCKSDGHFYNCNTVMGWEYLLASTRVDEHTALSILDLLSGMGKIDAELWKVKVIWCRSLVDNVADAYKKRTVSVPIKPDVSAFSERKHEQTDIFGDGNPQSIVNNTKEDIDEDEERVREGKVFEFFNQNICPITPFQSETISQALDEGMEPEMILEILKDSLGKREKWTWISRVLANATMDGTKTLAQYNFKKAAKAEVEAKSRDRPGGDGNAGHKKRDAGDGRESIDGIGIKL